MTVTITELPDNGVLRSGGVILEKGDQIRPEDLPKIAFWPAPGAAGAVGSFRYLVDDGRGGKADGRIAVSVAGLTDSRDLVSSAALWDRVRHGDRKEIEAFLTLLPGSRYVDAARARLAQLSAESATAPPAGAAPVPVASAAPPPSSAGPAPAGQAAAASSPERLASLRPAGAALQSAAPAGAAAADGTTVAMTLPPGVRRGGEAGRPSESFQDCPQCPVMRRVTGGGFTMGVRNGDRSAAPAHRVTLRAFAIGQFPVTVAEWRACIADGGCSGMPRMAHAADRMPVHNVSWDDAQHYVAWLSRKTGRKYRLPSEAEWEYAARGGTETQYWWGDEPGVALANCSDCGGRQDRLSPLPVGSFKPNPFGLYDVAGGVAEWVADCWHPDYAGAPVDGSAWERKGCQSRVLRGGSFRNDHSNVASASRNFYDASVRYPDNGFRVAEDLD